MRAPEAPEAAQAAVAANQQAGAGRASPRQPDPGINGACSTCKGARRRDIFLGIPSHRLVIYSQYTLDRRCSQSSLQRSRVCTSAQRSLRFGSVRLADGCLAASHDFSCRPRLTQACLASALCTAHRIPGMCPRAPVMTRNGGSAHQAGVPPGCRQRCRRVPLRPPRLYPRRPSAPPPPAPPAPCMPPLASPRAPRSRCKIAAAQHSRVFT